MRSPRTSEDDSVVGGEAIKAEEQDRVVPAEAKIIIDPTPVPGTIQLPTLPPRARLPRDTAQVAPKRPEAPARRPGLWLVVCVYVLATAALAAAIYERFFTH